MKEADRRIARSDSPHKGPICHNAPVSDVPNTPDVTLEIPGIYGADKRPVKRRGEVAGGLARPSGGEVGAREATQGTVEGCAERTRTEIVNRVRARVCSVRSTNTVMGTIQSTPGSHSATRAGAAVGASAGRSK